MTKILEEVKKCNFLKSGCLDEEITLTKKDLLLAGIATAMTGVVIGMLAAMKRRPPVAQPVPQEQKKKHCCFRKRLF